LKVNVFPAKPIFGNFSFRGHANSFVYNVYRISTRLYKFIITKKYVVTLFPR